MRVHNRRTAKPTLLLSENVIHINTVKIIIRRTDVGCYTRLPAISDLQIFEPIHILGRVAIAWHNCLSL